MTLHQGGPMQTWGKHANSAQKVPVQIADLNPGPTFAVMQQC